LWRYAVARETALETRLLETQRSAVALDLSTLQHLRGTRDDPAAPAYASLKQRLAQLDDIEADIRFVHLLRVTPDAPAIVFLADSQPPDSGETLAPGSVYPFSSADDLRPVLTAGTPAIL